MYIVDQHDAESFVITTDQTTLQTVGITLVFLSGVFMVDWGDGSAAEHFTSGIEKTKNYASTGTYEIKISGCLTKITQFIADNSRITSITGLKTGLLTLFRLENNLYSGNLDLSSAPVSNFVYLFGNSSMSGVTFASSGNGVVERMWIDQCGFTSLDFSNITIIGSLRGYSNTSLSSVTISAASNVFSSVDFNNCNLSSLDFINSTVNGTLDISSNPNFSSLIIGSGTISTLYLDNCNLSSLDISNLTLSGFVYLFNNSLLSSLILPASSASLTRFWVHGCSLTNIDFSIFSTSNGVNIRLENNSMSSTEVDDQLINLDNVGWINGIVNISGNNAARTVASDTAYNNLVANGWTITVN